MGLDIWPTIVFGWPSAIAGAVLLGAAVIRLRADVALLGALVSAGFLTYVALNPLPLRAVGAGCLAANVACAVAVKLGRRRAATLWLLPYLILLGWLAEAAL
ncbi:MAG TPA: hypothetical protein VGC00_00815 [Thermoanaerobaculia bacterium]|jgi:hypothetical protein